MSYEIKRNKESLYKFKLLEMFYISIDNEIDKWTTTDFLSLKYFTGPIFSLDDTTTANFVFNSYIEKLELSINRFRISSQASDYSSEKIEIAKYHLIPFSKSDIKFKKYIKILYKLYFKRKKEKINTDAEKENTSLQKTLEVLENNNKQNIRKEKLKRLS